MRKLFVLLIAYPFVVHIHTAAACDDRDERSEVLNERSEVLDNADDTVDVADADDSGDEEVAEVETPDLPPEIESRIDELESRLDDLNDRVNELGGSSASPQLDVDFDFDVEN